MIQLVVLIAAALYFFFNAEISVMRFFLLPSLPDQCNTDIEQPHTKMVGQSSMTGKSTESEQ